MRLSLYIVPVEIIFKHSFFWHFQKPLNWWNKKDEIIGRQKGRIQQNIYGNLIIKSVRLSDSGLYTCSSINGSVKHKSIELKISGNKIFSYKLCLKIHNIFYSKYKLDKRKLTLNSLSPNTELWQAEKWWFLIKKKYIKIKKY